MYKDIWAVRQCNNLLTATFLTTRMVINAARQGVTFLHWCRTKPERTLYLAFGHDEEVGGVLGAGAMARLLASRGVTLDFVVDEGGPILVDGLPSLLRSPTQIALVGTAEKVGPFVASV